MQMQKLSLKMFIAMLLMTSSVYVSAGLITFETDTTGAVSNGFESNEASGVAFSNTSGTMSLSNFGSQGDGISLGVFGDTTGGQLQIDFSFLVTQLSLDFGNDDPGFSGPGDQAYLRVFLAGTTVATEALIPNFDDVMNQTISYNGAAIDRALFWYGDAAGNTTTAGGNRPGITEVVDNIQFTAAEQVPVPTTLALFGLGLAGLGWSRRKKV